MQNLNDDIQPIGLTVSNWSRRPFPTVSHLTGRSIILEKLNSNHLPSLYENMSNAPATQWTYLPEEAPESEEEFTNMMLKKIQSSTEVFYAIVEKLTKNVIGSFSLMRIDQDNGVIEVGYVNFSPKLQRTTMATEAHYLLAKYVFEELGYRRYEWKCDSLNYPSNKSALRLGFKFEGTFRQAAIYKGRSRDTNWYSMLDNEWPFHRKALEGWLSEDNFDENRQELQKLEAFRLLK
ncbi:GNAT family protein [Enterococcus innesii]|uniref:GNAT family N-acetyltransferase n=1 Tax=Enterococcus innesii TaxID=2839759 RepID=UPI002DBBA030|nr:GNAT family protein [Enterococcus innesii]MEB5919363.1 GNAT family N-acetyltransferase [Enterococcus innesii]